MATAGQSNVIEAAPLFHVVKSQIARLRPALVVFDTQSDFSRAMKTIDLRPSSS